MEEDDVSMSSAAAWGRRLLLVWPEDAELAASFDELLGAPPVSASSHTDCSIISNSLKLKRPRDERSAWKPAMLVVVILVVIVGTAALFQRFTGAAIGTHAFQRSLTFVDYQRDEPILARLISYGTTVQAIAQHPILGHGQGATVNILSGVERDATGRFSLRFKAKDDFGVTAGQAIFRLNLAEVHRRHGLAAQPEFQTNIELPLPLTISGDRSDFIENLEENLSKHPWAHLPVSVMFQVSDIGGQIGQSESLETILPARNFFDPLAKALIEQRRDILWSSKNVRRASQILRAISTEPAEIFRDLADLRILKEIITQLEEIELTKVKAQSIERISESLWNLSIKIEDGDLEQAIKKLERAQDKLEEAIRNGATPAEISRLMEELREAQDEYLREFSQRNPATDRKNDKLGQMGDAVSENELQQMMDKLQQLLEDGRMGEAKDLLEEINQLMKNLQSLGSQSGQNRQENGIGGQFIEDLTGTLREQQRLSDQTFRSFQNRSRDGFDKNKETHNNDKPQTGSKNTSNQSLAEQQKNLKKELDRQRSNLPSAGTVHGEAARRALNDARRSMDQSGQNLAQGDLSDALDNQSKAIDALREGLQSLADSLVEEGDQGQGTVPGDQSTNNSSEDSYNLDPLGRNTDTNGQSSAGEQMLPEAELRLRSQELMNEIRKRSGGLERSTEERDYLKRLLEKF